jgi:signal transduction histidine kinase
MEAIAAGEAVLLAADLRPDQRAFVKAAGALLAENLVQLRAVEWARMRNDDLDLALAWTAHELRGPLVGARAALGHVRIDDREPKSQELLRQSREELDQLAGLVDPLLRWSTGSASLRKRPVNLFDVVDGCVTSCRREFPEGDVVLVGSVGIPVSADASQLRVAVSNLIRNALAYSPSGSTVTVTVGAVDGFGRVRIRDRGPGVPPAERRLIFDPFARGRVGDQGRSGSGLGLFIARRIVEAHGGAIGLRAARPGTEFHADLPLADHGRIRSAS